MTGQLVRWATPFETEPERLSVATASCCCCCCCCLASTAALSVYAARSPFDEARRNSRSWIAPLVLGVLAIPLGVLTGWLASDTLQWRTLAAALLVGIGVFEIAGQIAGSRPFMFTLRGTSALFTWLVASVLELQAVVLIGLLSSVVVPWQVLVGAWILVAVGVGAKLAVMMGAASDPSSPEHENVGDLS